MLLTIVRRLALRPHRLLRFLASLTALATNLKQMSEVTSPGGHVFLDYEERFRELSETVAMEAHQVQEHLGLPHGNPGWTGRGRCPHCGGKGREPDERPGRGPYSDQSCTWCGGSGRREDAAAKKDSAF